MKFGFTGKWKYNWHGKMSILPQVVKAGQGIFIGPLYGLWGGETNETKLKYSGKIRVSSVGVKND